MNSLTAKFSLDPIEWVKSKRFNASKENHVMVEDNPEDRMNDKLKQV